MATPYDYEKYKKYWPQWATRCNLNNDSRVLICSPDQAQYRLIQMLCPEAHLMQRTEVEWDLNRPWKEDPVDIIVACNVFHYSRKPDLWFKNCFGACRYLWIQDLISRPRGIHGLEFSTIDHGDCQRYRLGDNLIPSRYATFDLLTYQENLLHIEIYDAGSQEAKATLLNFIALFQGDIR